MKKICPRVILSRQTKDWSKLKGLRKLFSNSLLAMDKLKILPARQSRVEVLLSDDLTLAELNGNFSNKHKPTDVLSFTDGSIHKQILYLGEIAISWQQVLQQAKHLKYNNNYDKELQIKEKSDTSLFIPEEAIIERSLHLFIHGFLHLLEYDHSTNSQATEMEKIEIFIMDSLGYKNPYLENK